MAASDVCTAEAAGQTLSLPPEARYKTSFYSMLGGVGQTQKTGSRSCGARATQELPSFARPGRVEDPSPHDTSPHEHLRPKRPVQRPVLDGFGDVFGFDSGSAFQIGHGARHL